MLNDVAAPWKPFISHHGFFNVRNVKSEYVNERVFPYYITIQHHRPDLGPLNSNTRNKDLRINWSGLFFIATLVI